MDESKANKCEELTESILNALPPMRIIIFKSGKECIDSWMDKKGVKGQISYCPKAKHYMFYFKVKKENKK